MPLLRLTLVVTLSCLFAPSAFTQSGADVFESMRDAYERRMSGVRDYTIVQDMMGVQTTMYFEKEMVDGQPIFRLRRTETGGMVDTNPDEDEEGWDEMYTMADEFAAHANYVGRDAVDGHPVHVVDVTELEELGIEPTSPEDEIQFEAERARFYVDADEWVVRRMSFEGVIVTDEGSSDSKMTIDFSEYRTVDGMLHPFLMTMQWEGMDAVTGMSKEDMEEMRKQLDEMKAQLAEMPEAQRRMVEGMMKGQMEQLENMLSDSGGGMKFEIRVAELRVNTGG